MTPILLPPPEAHRPTALTEALRRRATIREIAPEPLPPGLLSALLWAAWGVNRP